MLLAIVVGFVWLVSIAVTDQVRQRLVDTWQGPDATVQSGILLDGCPVIRFEEDVYFPSWIRFQGRTYRWADLLVPIGPNSLGDAYLPTGYRHDGLELFRIANTTEGRAGRQIMVRQGTSFGGAVYLASSCG